MYNNYAYFIITYLTCTVLSYDFAYSMETTNNNLVVYSIPGQNGMGGDPDYIKCLFNSQNIPIVQVPTPTFLVDLGQFFCQRHLTQVIAQEKRDIIIHATSQGTATVLNYLSKRPNEKIKLLILESPLASGNQAIYHTATNELMPQFNFIKHIPGAYYIVPYIGAIMCPGYLPIGQQPIFSIQKSSFPLDIPIIIAHSQDDPQLSFSGARALYYGLKSRGTNIYFIPFNRGRHLNLFFDIHNTNKSSVLQKIIKKHVPNVSLGIIEDNNTGNTEDINEIDDDLGQYTPEINAFKKDYDELVQKENILWNTSVAGFVAFISYSLTHAKS